MGFKKGEKVICVNTESRNDLTLHKIYISLNDNYGIFIVNDDNETYGYPLALFKSLSEYKSEYRQLQIDKIFND